MVFYWGSGKKRLSRSKASLVLVAGNWSYENVVSNITCSIFRIQKIAIYVWPRLKSYSWKLRTTWPRINFWLFWIVIAKANFNKTCIQVKILCFFIVLYQIDLRHVECRHWIMLYKLRQFFLLLISSLTFIYNTIVTILLCYLSL